MPSLPFAEGFLLGLGLLIALGPKDTFVIKHSLNGHSALTLVAICAISDALLIALGVAGLGAAISSSRWLMVTSMVLSAGYLLFFSLQAFRSAYAEFDDVLDDPADEVPAASNAQVVKGALFHSLLTPYAWLDTVLVIGAISATKLGAAKLAFAGGAMIASFVWFTFLTIGSRLAAPLFQNRRTWQGLDIAVGISMLVLGVKLLADYPWRLG
ncbi:LysE/ArgO family amino acid transporter [Burkholderia alba]|uniref:LysE/ArgO family amino acid transporter n=1 Tax=Burkholderia alba TaxID=2683677 RepID=UPI002B052520|nr:LysE family transporter [Burkholderia alba]